MLLLLPTSTFAARFGDVAPSHKNATAISRLADMGWVKGYQNGNFHPERSISRAEAMKLLVTATRPTGLVDNTNQQIATFGQQYIPFRDVGAQEWFSPYVTLGYQLNIVRGYDDSTFRPHQPINFAEGLKMILSSHGVDVRRTRFQENPLVLMNSNDWFARSFVYAKNKNLINPAKFYHPGQQMTRGDFVEILYRLKTIQDKNLTRFNSTSTPFSNEYRITIPKLGIIDLNVNFADPYDAQSALGVLKDGLGHYLSPPGSGKKMVIFGHSSGFNWDTSVFKQILRQINKLQPGDRIYINFREKGYVYEMNSHQIMSPAALVSVMEDYGYEEIAMYTCWPPDSVAQRYVIHAGRVY